MNIKRLMIVFVLVVGVGLISSSAFANTVIFSDNFNGEHGGAGALNYTGFAQWTVTGGTVDLIGNGFFDFLPGNGLYVDLDGSTNQAGTMTTKNPITLIDGGTEYLLAFDLAGNQLNAGQERVTVAVMNGLPLYSSVFTVNASVPFQHFVVPLFPSAGQYNIIFHDASTDNMGALLDNVTLTQVNGLPGQGDGGGVIPEPTSLLLLGTGLSGIALFARRKKR